MLDCRYSLPFNTVLRWICPAVLIGLVLIRTGKIGYTSSLSGILLLLLFFTASFYSISFTYSLARAFSFFLVNAMYYNYYGEVAEENKLERVIGKLGIGFIIYEIFNFIYSVGSGGGRAYGITGNPNSLGIWSNIAFCFELYYFKRERGGFRKLFMLGMMGVSIYTAVASGSRTFTICILMNIVIAYFMLLKGNLKYVMIIITGCLLLLGYRFLYETIMQLPGISRLLEDGTNRGLIWTAGMSLVKQKPILGWGYGISQKLNTVQYLGLIPGYGDYGFAFHNSYLTVLIETGFVGLFVLIVHFALILYRGFTAYMQKKTLEIQIVLMLIVNMLLCFWGGSSMTSVGSTEGFFFWGLLMWTYVYCSSVYSGKGELKDAEV